MIENLADDTNFLGCSHGAGSRMQKLEKLETLTISITQIAYSPIIVMAVSKGSGGNDVNKGIPNGDGKLHSPIINKLEIVNQ